MSDYLTDLGYAMDPTRYATNAQKTSNDTLLENAPKDEGKSNTDLTFEDMLLLMVTQLQNQTIDNQADTNDMMNQLIQMTVMQALTEMSTQVEDLTNANIMTYSASLVGKEVTVGVVDQRTGKLAQEIVGTVTATGTMDGQPVIFVDDKYYYLSDIMAVGRLPEPSEEEDDDKVDGDKPTDPTKPGETEKPDETNKPTEPVEPGGGTESPDNGENGAPTEGEG